MIPQLPENNVVKLTTLFFRNASERRGISMYMTNEEWEQNNQDYLKESYEETGFTARGYAVRKLICGGCGRVFYTTIYTKKYCHSYWCGNQANNRRQREYRQMRRQDLVCQCCGEKFTPKRADARYCSSACRQKDPAGQLFADRRRIFPVKEPSTNLLFTGWRKSPSFWRFLLALRTTCATPRRIFGCCASAPASG